MPPGRAPGPELVAKRAVEVLHEKLRRESATSIEGFFRNVVIPAVPDARVYGEIREPWQKSREQPLIPAVEFIAGLRPEYAGPKKFWLGMAKSHDKTGLLARCLNWLLSFSAKKNIRAYCGAKDAGQAAVILDSMYKEATLNPWFADRLDFKRNRVDGKTNGAQLHILTSDAAGIQGINPDFIVCDEICHWDSRDLFDALVNGAAKRGGHAVLAVLTNAGFRNTWQWDLRCAAEVENGKSWSFYEMAEGELLASWLSKEEIEQTSRLVTPTEARRLYRNEWLDLTEDRGFLVPEDVDACVGPPEEPPPGATVYLGIDYGGVHDRTALVALWYDGERVQVFELQCWQGSKVNEVPVAEVESWIDRKLQQFSNVVAVFDVHQMLSVIQTLESRGVRVKRFDYKGGRANYAMAEAMRGLVTNRRIRFASAAGLHPDGSTLADELKTLIVKRVQNWYRFDHDSNTHDDRAVAVGMAAMEAVMTSPPPPPASRSPSKPPLLRPQRSNHPTAGFSRDWLAGRRLYGS